MLRFSRYLFVAIIPFLLISCGGDDKSSEADKAFQRAASKRAAAQRKAATEKADEEKKALMVPVKEFSPVNIGQLRNPFKSFMVKKPKKSKERDWVAGPLECCQIGTFNLLAIMSSIDEPKALVLAPDGKKHTLKLGDRIGTMGGVITSIDKSGVEISVELTDSLSDKVSVETVKMTLNQGNSN